MARLVANVDILTENFEAWVVRTNTLLDALSNEIVTANTSWANTGNSSVMRNAQLYGKLVANTIYLNDALSGGSNTTTTANLNITSNALFTGASVNVASNTTHTGLTFFTANVQANGALLNVLGTTVNVSSNIAVVSNNQSFSSNSTVQALYITGNATVTNTAINGNNFNVSTTNTYLTGINIISTANVLSTANSQLFKSNSSVTAISILGNSSATNTAIGGSDFNISSNVAITGTNHTISGNVNVDSGVLFVDGTNNRVGLSNSTPDATLAVTGTANVSANTRIGGVLTVANNTVITGFANVTTSVNSAILSVGTSFIANTTGAYHTGTINAASHTVGTNFIANSTTVYVGNSIASVAIGNNTITGTANIGVSVTNYLNVTGALSVSSNVAFSNTLNVTGATALSNSLSVTGAANALSTFGVSGAANALSTLGVTGLTTASGGLNTTTANASVAINVGANVNINATSLGMGDITLTANTRGIYTKDGVTLTDTVSEASNSFGLSITPTIYRNQKSWVNATVNVRDVAHLSRTEFYIVSTEDVFTNANNAGKIYANTTVLRVSNTTVNSEISTAQIRVGANVVATTSSITVGNSSVNTYITSTAIDTDGTLTVLGATTLSNNLSVAGISNAFTYTIGSTLVANNTQLLYTNTVSFSNTLGVTGAATLSNTVAVTGNATLSNTLAVTGAATLSNTIAVTGNATLSNTLAVTGTSTFGNTVTIKTDYVLDVYANSDIGSNSSAQVVYSFPKATYRGAKLTAIAAKGGNNMIAEMIVVHDGTTPYLTTYATISSPPSANNTALLGTYSTQINNANVEILLAQSTLGGNSSVKFVAHLIK